MLAKLSKNSAADGADGLETANSAAEKSERLFSSSSEASRADDVNLDGRSSNDFRRSAPKIPFDIVRPCPFQGPRSTSPRTPQILCGEV